MLSGGLIPGHVSDEQKKQFEQIGFFVVKALLKENEVEEIKDSFMKLHAASPFVGWEDRPLSEDEAKGDILSQYPRMTGASKVSDVALRYMLHPKVLGVLAELFGEEPLAAQDMFYFKPPGARGQALHQDNFFLKVEPGTCIAAWTAIDSADEENGCLSVVPRTNGLDIQCAHLTERTDLFAYPREVDVPEGMEAVPVRMGAGDVLFFGGNLIHGSYPNRSATRFRRSLICHYAGISTTRIGRTRLIRHDGTVVDRDFNKDAGPCGGEAVAKYD
jgi:ectoine hydroxylase-related dioxygenase (phytanoyl-CoA dioxygenase family)